MISSGRETGPAMIDETEGRQSAGGKDGRLMVESSGGRWMEETLERKRAEEEEEDDVERDDIREGMTEVEANKGD